jgi:hypothetical protein
MNLTADPADIATCVDVGVYAHALTHGNQYPILARDIDKRQVRARGDNGKMRWFPTYCFDLTGQPVVRLVRTMIEDPLDGAHSVDVEFELSDGQRRWCYFVTPQILSQLDGDAEFAGERLLSYHSPNMIVVSSITREVIEQSLAFIESHGEIVDCSMPML